MKRKKLGKYFEILIEYRPRHSRRRTDTPWHRWPAKVSQQRPRHRDVIPGICNYLATSIHSGRYSATFVALRRARPRHSPPGISHNVPDFHPCRCGYTWIAGDHLSAIAIGRPPIVIFADSSRVVGR